MMHFKAAYRNIYTQFIKLTKIFRELLSGENGKISLLKNKQIFPQEKNAVFMPVFAENLINKKYLAKEIGE